MKTNEPVKEAKKEAWTTYSQQVKNTNKQK